jgi:ribulose-5-phosphate 4-epimerase/fuculose-1-phosphate aldolase
MEQLIILAKTCRILARHGHNDFTLGHLSLRTKDGSGFWIGPKPKSETISYKTVPSD